MTKRFLMLPAILLACLAAPAHGQSPLSLWVGVGRPVTTDSVSFSPKNLDAYAALQLDLPLLPFGVRADATIAGGDIKQGRRNVSASAIIPLRLPIVEPYGMVGYGIYDWGKADEDRGINYGVGVRVHVARLGVFAQVRRHEALKQSIGTLGMTF